MAVAGSSGLPACLPATLRGATKRVQGRPRTGERSTDRPTGVSCDRGRAVRRCLISNPALEAVEPRRELIDRLLRHSQNLCRIQSHAGIGAAQKFRICGRSGIDPTGGMPSWHANSNLSALQIARTPKVVKLAERNSRLSPGLSLKIQQDSASAKHTRSPGPRLGVVRAYSTRSPCACMLRILVGAHQLTQQH